MTHYPCGCALGWQYGEGQCAEGARLWPLIRAAQATYQAAHYWNELEPARKTLLELEAVFYEHFAGQDTDPAVSIGLLPSV